MTRLDRRAPLSRDRIVAAALAEVDEVGAEGLTMRRLGQRLGVDPMAVYHHVPGKAALLDGIVERLWRGVDLGVEHDGEQWQQLLVDAFTSFRTSVQSHPRAATVVGTRPAVSPGMLALVDALLGRLESAGLPATEAMPLIDSLTAYTVGKVLQESMLLDEGTARVVGSALQSVTPESHPHLVSAMSTGYDRGPDDDFARGIRAIVDGWATAAR